MKSINNGSRKRKITPLDTSMPPTENRIMPNFVFAKWKQKFFDSCIIHPYTCTYVRSDINIQWHRARAKVGRRFALKHWQCDFMWSGWHRGIRNSNELFGKNGMNMHIIWNFRKIAQKQVRKKVSNCQHFCCGKESTLFVNPIFWNAEGKIIRKREF